VKLEIFNEYIKPANIKFFDGCMDFNRFVRAGGVHVRDDNDILEVYETRKLQFSHLFDILLAIGVITKTSGINGDEYKIDIEKEWTTTSWTSELIAKYAAMNRKSINQLFTNEYLELTGAFSTRTMGALLAKLCREVLGYEIKTLGQIKRRVEGKQVLLTKFKLDCGELKLLKHL
jgi:hypothetical protein